MILQVVISMPLDCVANHCLHTQTIITYSCTVLIRNRNIYFLQQSLISAVHRIVC